MRGPVNRRQLLKRLARGAVQNVAFADMVRLVEGLGFRQERVSGSHHIFVHPEVPDRQLLRLVERYNLDIGD